MRVSPKGKISRGFLNSGETFSRFSVIIAQIYAKKARKTRFLCLFILLFVKRIFFYEDFSAFAYAFKAVFIIKGAKGNTLRDLAHIVLFKSS